MPDDGTFPPTARERLARVEALMEEVRNELRRIGEQVEDLRENMHRQKGMRMTMQALGVAVMTVCSGAAGAAISAIASHLRGN